MQKNKIEKIILMDDVYESFMQAYDKKIPIILYGNGKGCIDAINMLKEKNINPVAICDTNTLKYGTNFKEIPVMSIEEAKLRYKDFYVFISAPVYVKEITEYLRSYIEKEKIYFFWKFRNKKEFSDYMYLNLDYITELYEILTDEFSKKTLINILKGWSSSDYKYFKASFTENQYFPSDLINLESDEVFVDAGAFIGDTLLDFINRVNGKFKKIYAFEPNSKCFSDLDKIEKEYGNVILIKKGAYEFEGEIGFNNDETISKSSAHLTENKETKCVIKVNSIDNEIKERVTFIKMDIEGVELSALKGAKKTILKYKPKLAICIYHNYEDIIEIPRYLKSLGLDYKYYLRHHSYYSGETVLYAV